MSYPHSNTPTWPPTPPMTPEDLWHSNSPRQHYQSRYTQSSSPQQHYQSTLTQSSAAYNRQQECRRLMAEQDKQQTGGSEAGSSSKSSAQQPLFLCLYEDCANKYVGFVRKADLERHVQAVHESAFADRYDCMQPNCHRKGEQGFTRKDKMIDHMREVHKVDIAKRQYGGRRTSKP